MKNSKLNKFLYSFKYFFINNDTQFNIKLSQDTDMPNIVTIDMYEEQQNKYFIICFKGTLLVIPQSYLNNKQSFFNSKNATFYFIQSYIKPLFIDQLSKYKNFSLQNFKSYNSDDLFETEIESFSNVLMLNDHKAMKFWKIIRQCISGYFIKLSYNKTTINRIKNYKKILMSKPQENLIQPNDFIHLRHSGDSNISHIELLYHIENEELFVAKIIFDSEEPKLFHRELSNYLNCPHPFLARYFGTIEFGPQKKHLAIEYIHGKTLSYINDINLDFYQFLRILFEILVAFHYIHRSGYIYRDLKPNNVIIDKNNNCVLIDFDRMVKNTIENTGPSSTKTFNSIYMAPELFEEDGYTEKVDVYSIGKIINFIFFENRNKIEQNTKFKILQNDFDFLHHICDQCLQDDPKKRPDVLDIMMKIFDYIYLRFFILFQSNNYIDYEEFLDYWSTITRYSLPQKLNNVGIFYSLSQNVPGNNQKAIDYLTIAATEKNNSAAQRNLANYYLIGEIVPKDLNKSIYYFKLAADNNDVEAQYSLGKLFYEGKYVKKDVEKALYYFKKASDQNHKEAQFLLGFYYVMIDYRLSIYYLSLSAEQNFPEAQFVLGNLYLKGTLVEQNVNKAINYLILSANQKNHDAQELLSKIYKEGKYVPVNRVKYVEYLVLSSTKNESYAYFKLGYIYYFGKLVQKDFGIAFNYFLKGAELNSLDAINYLGLIYYEGIYLPQNISKTIQYWTYSANNGQINSQFNLGCLYYIGNHIQRDINRAIHYFTLAANNGYSESFYILGEIYFVGEYVQKNIKKAIHYFQLVIKIDKNNLKVLNILGRIYYDGIYLPKDVNKALNYIKRAADSYDSDSLYNLGYIYYDGKNFPRNIEMAIYYLKLSAEQNNCKANYTLGFIYYYGIDVPKDFKKAINYFQIASRTNMPESLFYLAKFYIKGIYVPQDIEKGINYLTLSANQKFSIAQNYLGCIYYEGKYVERNINKAIYYLNQSANNDDNIQSYFVLGIIYQQGLYVSRDIEKAIFNYKQASSFNSNNAKNNLAIIFKNGFDCNQNIPYAIELLDEAIRQKNDPVAMYNLAHIYFFNYEIESKINECITLLKKSAQLHFNPAKDFLCLVFTTKYNNVTKEIIKNEIIDDRYLVNDIFDHIKDEMLENYENRMNLNKEIKNIDYTYDSFTIIPTKDFMNNLNQQNKNILQRNITDSFYDGFGI